MESHIKTYTLLINTIVLQVNQYPGQRDFKAIGSGGDDFKQTIVRAVEDIVGPVNQDRVMERPSSQGKFISVTLRDVKVQNPDQVTSKMHHGETIKAQHCIFGWHCITVSKRLALHCIALHCSLISLLPAGSGCVCSNEKGQKTEVLLVKTGQPSGKLCLHIVWRHVCKPGIVVLLTTEAPKLPEPVQLRQVAKRPWCQAKGSSVGLHNIHSNGRRIRLLMIAWEAILRHTCVSEATLAGNVS